MAGLIPIGSLVQPTAPFDAEPPSTIVAVQFVNDVGELVDEPTDKVQYILDSGLSYDPKYLEVL